MVLGTERDLVSHAALYPVLFYSQYSTGKPFFIFHGLVSLMPNLKLGPDVVLLHQFSSLYPPGVSIISLTQSIKQLTKSTVSLTRILA